MRRRTKTQELFDFEIAFYEKLLVAYPNFLDALIPLAHAYTKNKQYDKGLDIDLRVVVLKNDDPLAWYNLACSYALLKQANESLAALQKAIQFGYRDMRHLQQDPDLFYLRQSPEFHRYIASLTESMASENSPAPSAGTPKP